MTPYSTTNIVRFRVAWIPHEGSGSVKHRAYLFLYVDCVLRSRSWDTPGSSVRRWECLADVSPKNESAYHVQRIACVTCKTIVTDLAGAMNLLQCYMECKDFTYSEKPIWWTNRWGWNRSTRSDEHALLILVLTWWVTRISSSLDYREA